MRLDDSMNLGHANRLFRQAGDQLNRLETALFAAVEAGVLGLNETTERANASRRLTDAVDTLLALANLDPSAIALRQDVERAATEAKADPFDVVELAQEVPDDHETEVFRHPLVLRDLLGRIAAIYGLDPDQLEQGLTVAQGHLLTICRNASASINAMLAKKLIAVPRGEHQVKQLLYAIARASFVDVIPDGGIEFEGEFQNHKPDFGVPRLKTCVETKIARDKTSMSSAIDGIIADQSNYGSDKYNRFIGVIYTNNDTLTQEQLDQEIADRMAKGGWPSYEWHWVLIHGQLEPPRKRSDASRS